jgi:hypothetical protein
MWGQYRFMGLEMLFLAFRVAVRDPEAIPAIGKLLAELPVAATAMVQGHYSARV